MQNIDELQHLQLRAKKKTEKFFSIAKSMTLDDDWEGVMKLREKALRILERADALGDQVRKACIADEAWNVYCGADDDDSDDDLSRTVGCVQLLIPPVTAAAALMLVRETHVIMRELLAHGNCGDATKRDILEAVRHAKEAYNCERHVASIIRQVREALGGGTHTIDEKEVQSLHYVEERVNQANLAKSQMQIAVLLDTAGKSEQALKRHRKLIKMLKSAHNHMSTTESSATHMQEVRELLPVAMHNLSCVLGRVFPAGKNASNQAALQRKVQDTFSLALDALKLYLDPDHPLFEQLKEFRINVLQGEIPGEPRPASRRVSTSFRRYSAKNTNVPSTPHINHQPVNEGATGPSSSTNAATEKQGQRPKFPNLLETLGSRGIKLPSIQSHLPTLLRRSSNSLSLNNNTDTNFLQQHDPLCSSEVGRRRMVDIVLDTGYGETNPLFTCHRLRRPSDALRLGGVDAEDPLFAHKKREEEQERQRILELRRQRRKERRRRSFVPSFIASISAKSSTDRKELSRSSKSFRKLREAEIDCIEESLLVEGDSFLGGERLLACFDRMKRDHADRKKRKTRDRSVELCSEDNNLTSGNRAPDSDALSSLLSRAKARTKKDEDGNSITLVLDEITSGDALTSQSDRRKSGRRGTKRKEIQEEGEKKDSRTLFNDFSSGDGLLARLGLIGDDDVKKKRRPKRKVRVSVSRPSDACSSKNAYQSPLDDSVAARRMTLESDPQCLREGLGEGLLVSNSALVGSSQIPPERVGGGHARRPSTKVPSSSRRGRRVGSFPKVARSSVAGSLKSYEQSEGRLSEIPSMSEGEGVTGGGTTIWEGLPKPKRGKKRSYDGGESRATEDSDEDSTYDSEETDESYESDEEEESEEETVQEKKERCETELLNYFQQLFMWRMLSARKIQCAWRCYKARLALKERQQILYRHVYRVQKAATLCIQGFLQSVVGRKKLRLTQERYMIATEERAAAENRVIKSALLIADHVAAFLERRRSERELCKLLNLSNRKELQLRCVAQTLVARWWRLVLPRKRYWQRREKEVEEARSMEFLLKKQNIAAITIQRHCRGRLCRKMVEQLKRELVQRYETRQRLLHENVDLIRLCLQEFTRRCERLALEAAHRQVKQEEAAAVIQSGWRAALRSQAINNALDHCRRTSKAVLTIQRIYRRYRNDGAVRYFRRIQQVANLDRLEREYRIYRATVRLQSFARMVLAKRSARQLRAAIGRGYFFAAAVIQAACRGGAARLQLACVRRLQRQAMELYQWLCLEQKKRIVNHVCAFLRARMSCQITEQRRCRRLSEKLLLRRVVRRQLLLDKSASIIQRGVRRWLTRRREREAEERERALRALVLSCVTRIQAVMRGFLARCDYRHRRFYAQRERQRREEMEEVAVEMWVDEWRAALLQWELDRRRVESLEKTARDVIEWCFSRASLPAAATPLVVKNVMRDTDDSDDDLDPIYSTYRDDP